MIITVWERRNGDRYEHNHISEGYDPWARYPEGKTPEQTRNWRGAQWQSRRANLIDNKVVFRDGH